MFLLDAATDRRASRRRRSLAEGLESSVRQARSPRPVLTAQIPVARGAVEACADRMLALAAILRSARPLPAEGEATLRALLCDGAGPLYLGDDVTLAHALTRAEIRLGLR